jgi:hypothetical protein
VTWTWEGLTAWQILLYSLTQFNLNCTVQYLDPYVPDAEEIKDSKLFAANVRAGAWGSALRIFPNARLAVAEYGVTE